MIEGLENLKTDNLGIRSERLKVLKDEFFKNTRDMIRKVELYKLISNEELVDNINAIITSKEKLTVVDTVDLSLTKELAKICSKYEVLLQPVGSTVMQVIVDAFNFKNKNVLELDLAKYEIEYKYITPGNFNKLLGVKEDSYDYNILFRRILVDALEQKASDIHFGVKHFTKEPSYTIEYRVNNEIIPCTLFSSDNHMNNGIIYKLVSAKSGANENDLFDNGVETNVVDPLGDKDSVLRLSANRCEDGYMYVLRIQRKDTVTLKINELGFDEETEQLLERFSHKLNGATFITGAIRSGKNTTAFAMANVMVKKPIKIVSYDSPIETLMPFPQVNYRGDRDTLIECIKRSKKQDLNVAFINEIPDKSVAFAVRDLVNSSVHVITTFHINRIWHLPQKLYEFYGDSYKDVITQINGVCNQKMFVKQCPHCRRQILVESIKDAAIRELLEKHEVRTTFVSSGCDKCKEGKVPNGVQPYVECLDFNINIKRGLLKLDRPYEMEDYIYEVMQERETSLEYKLCKAVKEGTLHYNCLYEIV